MPSSVALRRRRNCCCSILFVAAILNSLVAAEPWPVPDWQVVPPPQRRHPPTALAPVLDFARDQDSRALLIVHDGRLECEAYFDGWNADRLHPAASAAKSVTSALVGIAIAEGALAGTEETLSAWFPDWTTADQTGSLAGVTLADLLTMRSGLPYDKALQKGMHRAPDWLAYIQEQRPIRAPGTRFHYSGFDPILISAILARATEKPLNRYAEEVLFRPLGIDDAMWHGDAIGLTNGGSQLSLTARDFARFGLLYLRKGRWDGRQIVPSNWVERSTNNRVGGAPWYGYLWWNLPAKVEASDARLRGCFFASGGGGQHAVILPAIDTVIVRLGENPTLRPSGQKFLPELLRRWLAVLP